MAAIVDIKRLTSTTPGESGAVTLTGTQRMKQADNPTVDTANPIPAVGTIDTDASVSCWWSMRLRTGATGATTGITNIKWYDNDPTMATGTKLRGEKATGYVAAPTTNLTYGAAGQLTTTTYATMAATGGANGSNLGDAAGGSVYTSGAMLTIGGSDPGTAINTYFGDWMVYQLQVASTAAPGVMSPIVTCTWQYDET